MCSRGSSNGTALHDADHKSEIPSSVRLLNFIVDKSAKAEAELLRFPPGSFRIVLSHSRRSPREKGQQEIVVNAL